MAEWAAALRAVDLAAVSARSAWRATPPTWTSRAKPAASRGDLEIDLEVESPTKSQVPGSTDPRLLGIGLVEYRLAAR
jgi:hypothetical protein